MHTELQPAGGTACPSGHRASRVTPRELATALVRVFTNWQTRLSSPSPRERAANGPASPDSAPAAVPSGVAVGLRFRGFTEKRSAVSEENRCGAQVFILLRQHIIVIIITIIS